MTFFSLKRNLFVCFWVKFGFFDEIWKLDQNFMMADECRITVEK